MDYTEIKEYELKFVIDRAMNLRVTSSVSIDGKLPTSLDDYYWIEKAEYTPIGFMYTVSGFDKQYHESELFPLSPVLVSKDSLEIGDNFYCEGEIHEVFSLFFDNETEKWMVASYNGFMYHESETYKVIATYDQFGWFYNEGPPHDHNYNWKDSRYLEMYLNTCIIDAIKRGFKMTIMVEEICPNYGGSHIGKDCSCKSGFKLVPKMHEGKIIIDQYNLLRDSKSTFKY
jgi:hypothetical protein